MRWLDVPQGSGGAWGCCRDATEAYIFPHAVKTRTISAGVEPAHLHLDQILFNHGSVLKPTPVALDSRVCVQEFPECNVRSGTFRDPSE